MTNPLCPSCSRPGDMENQLAPNQYRCPADNDVCRTVTFMGSPEDGTR